MAFTRVGCEARLHVSLADEADVAHDADGELAKFVVFGVGQGLRRGDDDALAGVDAQGVEVFHVADRDTVVETVAHHFILHFFPALEALFHQHLRREGKGLFGQHIQFSLVVAEAGAQTAQSIGGTEDDGIAQRGGSAAGVGDVGASLALDGLDIDLIEALYEELAVFGVHDGLNGRTEDGHAIFLKDAFLMEGHTAVEGGLTTEGQHDALRAFAFDDLLDAEGGDGQEIDTVGHALGSLYRSDIGVDEHGFNAFFLEGFQGLRPRIVKLAGFANLEGAGTEQQHFLY